MWCSDVGDLGHVAVGATEARVLFIAPALSPYMLKQNEGIGADGSHCRESRSPTTRDAGTNREYGEQQP